MISLIITTIIISILLIKEHRVTKREEELWGITIRSPYRHLSRITIIISSLIISGFASMLIHIFN